MGAYFAISEPKLFILHFYFSQSFLGLGVYFDGDVGLIEGYRMTLGALMGGLPSFIAPCLKTKDVPLLFPLHLPFIELDLLERAYRFRAEELINPVRRAEQMFAGGDACGSNLLKQGTGFSNTHMRTRAHAYAHAHTYTRTTTHQTIHEDRSGAMRKVISVEEGGKCDPIACLHTPDFSRHENCYHTHRAN